MTRMSRLFAAVPVVAMVALTPAAAHADFYRHGYGYGPYRGYYGGPRAFGPSYYGPRHYGPRHFGTGGLVAGTLLGLGVGAAIAGTVPRPYVPPPVVYAPPPVVYAPPPVVYAPPPPVYAPRPYYPAPAYYGPGYGYYR